MSKPMRIVAVVAGAIGAVILMGAGSEWSARRHVRIDYPLRGRLVDVGGHRLQLDCRGTGSPTVVFESGLDLLGSLSWELVHDSVARTTRACAYSRAGIMWSEPARDSFTAERVARELRTALRNAGEAGPFVMVGHSLGGPYVTTFTGSYGADVAGIVLVDPSHPDQVARLERATGLPMTPPTGLLSFGSAVAGTGLVRLMTHDVAPAEAPPAVRAASAAYAPLALGSSVQEAKAFALTMEAAGRYRDFGARPLIVLAAMAEMSVADRERQHMTRAQASAFRDERLALLKDESTWSRRGRLILVPDAGHYIQLDRPDAVIAAVREVVCAVRGDAHAAAGDSAADAACRQP